MAEETKRLPETYIEGFHRKEDVLRMRYTPLGNTGLNVSVLGFGASPFSGGYHQISEDDAIQSVKRALVSGVNYIDTAPWYGDGKSEQMLGKALKDIPRSSYYIATKVGRYKPEVQLMFDFTADRVLQSVDESLRLLGLPYVDILQVHDLEFAPNPEMILNETLPALERVRAAGKARFIGITGYPIDQLRSTLERSTVKIDTVLSYCHLTLADCSLLDHVDYFKERGVGIVNAASLSMGLLTTGGPPKWHPAGEEVRQACRQASLYCTEQGVDISKLAVYFSLSHDMAVNLIGITGVSDVEKNLDAVFLGIDEKESKVMRYILEMYFKPVKVKSWEGIEVSKYWRKFKELQGQ